MDDIAALKAGLLADIERTETPGQVEELRVGALGKQGVVTALLKTLGGMLLTVGGIVLLTVK